MRTPALDAPLLPHVVNELTRGIVLVVEDERDMAFALERRLGRDGYAVIVARDGEEALRTVRERQPDAIVLDVMLPELNGFQVLRTLRTEGIETPVLMLTARSAEADKLLGFRSGADDYLTKPFSIQELLARLAAILRRAAPRLATGERPSTRIAFGTVVVDVTTRTVSRDNTRVPLTPRAYELLLVLARQPGRTIPRRELLREVWGYRDDVTSRTLDAHIAELRRKLERDPRAPEHIITIWRVGYRFEDVSSAQQ